MTEPELRQHLRRSHGYDLPYSVSAATVTLEDEHRRIHEDLTAINLDHTHEDEQ